jgi:hypothetical protein
MRKSRRTTKDQRPPPWRTPVVAERAVYQQNLDRVTHTLEEMARAMSDLSSVQRLFVDALAALKESLEPWREERHRELVDECVARVLDHVIDQLRADGRMNGSSRFDLELLLAPVRERVTRDLQQ